MNTPNRKKLRAAAGTGKTVPSGTSARPRPSARGPLDITHRTRTPRFPTPDLWVWITKDGKYYCDTNPPTNPDEVKITQVPFYLKIEKKKLEEAYDRAMSIL